MLVCAEVRQFVLKPVNDIPIESITKASSIDYTAQREILKFLY